MARDLKIDTATNVLVGPTTAIADAIAPVVAMTVGDVSCDLFKGVARTALTLTTVGAGVNDLVLVASSDGYWNLELTAANVDTLGELTIGFSLPAVFLPFKEVFNVISANEYDSKYSTDVLQVHVVEFTADVINAAAIADGAIDAATFASGAINAAAIATNAITDTKINTGAITAAKIAANAITATKINDATITAAKIDTGAITADKIAANAIAATKIATGAITNVKFAAGAIDAAAIATGAIDADAIAADAIGTSELATSAVNAIRDSIIDDSISFNGADIPLILTDTNAIKVQTDKYPEGFKYGTELANFCFTMVDETDGYTLETGKTVTEEISKDGASYGNLENSASEIDTSGTYKITLSATDLTCTTGIIRFSSSGCRTKHIFFKTET